ncbi:MAG: hypothetical protein LBR19_01765 [Bifidobacteriaceae bacterium]|jgi:hypothetical protein|nr:hypothetical protein [Bifidobacteriaceae bacterium]
MSLFAHFSHRPAAPARHLAVSSPAPTGVGSAPARHAAPAAQPRRLVRRRAGIAGLLTLTLVAAPAAYGLWSVVAHHDRMGFNGGLVGFAVTRDVIEFDSNGVPTATSTATGTATPGGSPYATGTQTQAGNVEEGTEIGIDLTTEDAQRVLDAALGATAGGVAFPIQVTLRADGNAGMTYTTRLALGAAGTVFTEADVVLYQVSDSGTCQVNYTAADVAQDATGDGIAIEAPGGSMNLATLPAAPAPPTATVTLASGGASVEPTPLAAPVAGMGASPYNTPGTTVTDLWCLVAIYDADINRTYQNQAEVTVDTAVGEKSAEALWGAKVLPDPQPPQGTIWFTPTASRSVVP